MNSPKVYVVQESTLNLAKATRFGELIALLPGRTNIVMSPQPIIRELRKKLKDFNDEDFLLTIGDPAAIAVCSMMAAEINAGKIKLLKWDNHLKDYYVVKVDLHDRAARETHNDIHPDYTGGTIEH